MDAALVLGPLATLIAEAALGWTAITAGRRRTATDGAEVIETLTAPANAG